MSDQRTEDDGRRPGEAATRMLDKLRRFIDEALDPDERQALAALLAPGVARAHEPEVVGFGASTPEWLPDALPDALGAAIRDRDVRVEGL